MKQLSILGLAVIFIFASCSKDPAPMQPVTNPVPVPAPADDTVKVLLKDVLETNMPSPFYHFEYDNNKYATKISFASDLDVYNIQYTNKRVSKLVNTKNLNQVIYTYSNGRVSLITEISGITGKVIWKYYLDYNNQHQLTALRWLRFENNATDSIDYRKTQLSYYSDGNLATINNWRQDSSGNLVWSSRIEYRDYDNGVNVNGFALLKDFFSTLLFTPSVQLQKNNPRTEIITGSQNDYRTTYSYQYDLKKRPLLTVANTLQTRGTSAGQGFTSTSQYSYY